MGALGPWPGLRAAAAKDRAAERSQLWPFTTARPKCCRGDMSEGSLLLTDELLEVCL